MGPPIEVTELIAFTRTVDAKSLSRAAVELGVPRATVGRRLARLEESLGVRLLKRTTRSLMLTDAGEAFYAQARLAIEAVERAAASVAPPKGEIGGALRVSVPAIIDDSFEEMLLKFASDHPRVRLSIDLSTRFVDLHREGYDIAIRAGTQLEPGLIARSLSRTRLLAVASPAYVAKMGVPRSPSDLAQHRCLAGFMRGELPQTSWPLADGGRVPVEGAFSTNGMPLLYEATLRGHGIAYLPELLVSADLRDGSLVPILPGVMEVPVRLAIVYRERQLLPAAHRAFIDAVSAWAARFFSSRDKTLRPRKRSR